MTNSNNTKTTRIAATTTPATPTPSNIGRRACITMPGHRYAGAKGTIIGETKSNWRIQIDGVKTAQVVAKPGTTTPGCRLLRGRRPKTN